MGDTESVNKPNHNKRKRKKTFLTNARKYGKRGYYGRGSQLDADTYQYFVRILEAYKEGFPSEEDKRIFVNNVFEQTENEEVNCCCNQVGCRVVEMLLPFANELVFERYIKILGEDLRPLCSDRFASHVLETLLTECYKKSINHENDEFKAKCNAFAIKISKFLLNNLEDYVWDTYGNHVIRKVLINFAQLPHDEKVKKTKIEEPQEETKNLPEYIDIVKDYSERLITWPQFKELPYSEVTSGLLQILLNALKKVDDDLLKKYLKKLLSECFIDSKTDDQNESKLAEVFMSKAAMMTLETYLEVASNKMYLKLYKQCFANNLSKLSTTRATNFAVQKLIGNCKDKEDFEAMYDELSDHFKEIIDAGHTGIILAVGQGCQRLSAKQGYFVQELMKALNCFEPEESQNKIAICLAKFCTYENIAKLNLQSLDKEKLNLHGALLIQLILEFNKPIKMVNSLLSLEAFELKSLFSNTMGSHIVDSYVKSNFVGEKSRERLIRKLQGTYQDLASTKYGSRSFDAIWNVCNIKFKLSIMNELSHKESSWSHTEYGKIISSKINIGLYKKNKEEWKNSLNQKDKIKPLLDLIS